MLSCCTISKISRHRYQLKLVPQQQLLSSFHKNNPYNRNPLKTAPAKDRWCCCCKFKRTWIIFRVNSSSCRCGIIQQWRQKTRNKFRLFSKHLSTKIEIILLSDGLSIWISENICLKLKRFLRRSFISTTSSRLLKKSSKNGLITNVLIKETNIPLSPLFYQKPSSKLH